MLTTNIILGLIAVVLLFIGYQKGGGQHIAGLKVAAGLLLQVAPLLVFSFIIAGMVQELIPGEVISNWIGAESGFRGIVTGALAGAMTPGGPFISMPIAAGFLRTGAGAATMVAFMTSWSLIAIHRLPMEIGILGWKFMLVRLACVFLFPFLAGLFAHLFFSRVQVV